MDCVYRRQASQSVAAYVAGDDFIVASSRKSQSGFRASFHTFRFSPAGVANHCFSGIWVKGHGAILAGLDAPAATVAFCFVDSNHLVLFRLGKSVFWTCFYAGGIKAGSACYGYI